MTRQDGPDTSESSSPSALAAEDDDSKPWGYVIGGECGHRVPIESNGRVGECRLCDPGRPAVVDLRLAATELYSISAMASVDIVSWWCWLCDHEGTSTSAPVADTAAVEHLVAQHGAFVAAT